MTVLKTYTANSSVQEVSVADIGYTFSKNTYYFWNVMVNDSYRSDKAMFLYDDAPQRKDTVWNSTAPKAYSVVGKSGRFADIRSNLLTLISKYDTVDSAIQNKANDLFSGQVVPARKDFECIENILEYVGSKEEITYEMNNGVMSEYRVVQGDIMKWDNTSSSFSAFNNNDTFTDGATTLNVPRWIKNGLGVSDIENIADYIDFLLNRKPEPPADFAFGATAPVMYGITSVTPYHDNNTDTSIDVSWIAMEPSKSNGIIYLNDMSSSEDVWFYELKLTYGPNGKYYHNLFFREKDILDNSTIPSQTIVTVRTSATNYEDGSTIPMSARGNKYKVLDVHNFQRSYSNKSYFLDVLGKWVLEQDIVESGVTYGSTSIDIRKQIIFDAKWGEIYTADTFDGATQKVELCTIDHAANISNTRTIANRYNSDFKVPIGIDHYEMEVQMLGLGSTNYDSNSKWGQWYSGSDTKTTWTISGGDPGNLFHRVRVIDKSGLISDWKYSPYITFDPLLPPSAPSNVQVCETDVHRLKWSWNHGERVEKYQINFYGDHADFIAEWYQDDWSGGWLKNFTEYTGLAANHGYVFFIRSVNRVGTSEWVGCSGYTKADITEYYWDSTAAKSWRNNWGWRTDNSRVYQGEWCEIAGEAHPSGAVGTCWGKHKGMWFFNYNDIRAKLAGKSIIDAQLYVKREDTYHGYYSDQVLHLWLHGYGSKPDGEPGFFDHYEVRSPTFAKGESAWIPLPTYYGEKMRDGSAAGFGLYVPDWGRSPYVYCNSWAQLYIKAQG